MPNMLNKFKARFSRSAYMEEHSEPFSQIMQEDRQEQPNLLEEISKKLDFQEHMQKQSDLLDQIIKELKIQTDLLKTIRRDMPLPDVLHFPF